MIKADLENKGTIAVTGSQDVILTEYTILTRVVLNQLAEDHGPEKALNILAGLGQIAAKDIDELGGNLKSMYNDIEEVFHNEI